MAYKKASVKITREPAYADPSLIIKAQSAAEPLPPETPGNIDDLYPLEIPEYIEHPETRYEERDLLINIETTGVLPFESRLFSIAILDTTKENPEPEVFIERDEQKLINEFFDWFDSQNFTRLVGWNLSFDYRFLWAIAAKYRRPIPKWIRIKLRDVQQIYQQVKEEFVYGFQKPNKQEEWSKFLFGRGKYAVQEEVLKRYLAGDYVFIAHFQLQQIRNLRDLYALARYLSSDSSYLRYITSHRRPETVETPQETVETEVEITPKQKKICSVCLAENPPEAQTCVVCGSSNFKYQ